MNKKGDLVEIETMSYPDDSGMYSSNGTNIRIPFSPLNTPVSWYSMAHTGSTAGSTGSTTNKDSLVFPLVRTKITNYVTRVMAEFQTPDVSVKDKYLGCVRIRWTDHLALVMMNVVLLHLGEVQILLDYHSMVFYLEFILSKGRKKDYYRSIGHTAKYRKFSTHLRGGILDPIIPFFLSRDTSCAVPLFLADQSEIVLCEMTPVLEISKLIVMEKMDDEGNFQLCPFDAEYINPVDNVPKPTIKFQHSHVGDDVKHYWEDGCYLQGGDISDEEKEKIIGEEGGKYPNYFINLVATDPKDSTDYGATDSLGFSDPSIHKMFFWASQNNKSVEYNLYTNYSTNPFSPEDGRDPVEINSLRYKRGKVTQRFSEPSHFFNGSFTAEHFSSTSSVIGHKAFTFAYSAVRSPLDTGVPLYYLGAELSIKYLAKSHLTSEEKESDKGFVFILRSGIINKLTVSNGKFAIVSNAFSGPAIRPISR